MTDFLILVRGVTKKQSLIAEAMIANLKEYAIRVGHGEIVSKINKAYMLRRKAIEKN